MSQPTPREILDRVAEHMIAVPRGRFVNRSARDGVTIGDVLRVIEETAAEFGAEPREWKPDW